jgi:hypothetical protein
MLNNWKPQTYRNEAYLQFIREQTCCVPGCNETPCDPHHVKEVGTGGMSLKCDDLLTVPCCRRHHSEFGNCGKETAQGRFKINFIEIERDMLRKYVKQLQPMKEKP